MPPELMQFLDTMRTRLGLGQTAFKRGQTQATGELERFLTGLDVEETAGSKKQIKRGQWGQLLAGAGGFLLPHLIPGGGALKLALKVGLGALGGGALAKAKFGDIGQIKDMLPKAAQAYSGLVPSVEQVKRRKGDINLQRDVWNKEFDYSILTNAAMAAALAGGSETLQNLFIDPAIASKPGRFRGAGPYPGGRVGKESYDIMNLFLEEEKPQNLGALWEKYVTGY